MRILAYQPKITGINSAGERCAHVKRMAVLLEALWHEAKGVELIILPELATVEYSSESFENLSALAEPLLGETFQEMAALARRIGCAISYGFPRVEHGNYLISQMVVGPEGQYVTHYDKIHLAQFGASMEQEYFSHGQRLTVFDLGGIRFGIIICYDFRFSELINLLVDKHGVDVIVHPVAFTRDGTYESWYPFVVCRALENQIYFLSINRAGQEWGGSVFCPPWMDEATKPVILGTEAASHIIEIDRKLIESVRKSYPIRQDKRQDYSILSLR